MTTIGFIGMGKMGMAIANGLLSNGYQSSTIIFYDTDLDLSHQFSTQTGCQSMSLNEVVNQSDLILICIKPQQLQALFQSLPTLPSIKLGIVSILAGSPISHFENTYGASLNICRAMPNTPATIGYGVTGLSFNQSSSQVFQDTVRSIFATVGSVVSIPENHMDLVTALSGSGPAFFYEIIQVLCHESVRQGLDYHTALQLATQTMIGAGKLIQSSDQSVDQLINNVSSPGGTTVAGLNQFRSEQIGMRLASVLNASISRAQELAQGD